MLSNDKKSKISIHFGIQLLRTILSFNIVVDHCLNKKYLNKPIYIICIMGIYHYVPIFFVISFYFSYKTFSSRNLDKLKERLLRISIPYLIWPCLIWLKSSFFNRINRIKDQNKYQILIYQLIIGKPLNPVFWFQFILLFWSILFTIIIIGFKHTYNYIMFFMFVIILYLNCFGYTNKLFINYKYIIVTSVKELFIRIIYIQSGLIFGIISVLDKTFVVKIKIILFSVINIFIINFSDNNKKFYSFKILFTANIIFLSFSFFPFSLINKNKTIIFIIIHLTNFTGGIYYLHWEIKYRTMNNLNIIKKGDFLSCIFIISSS